MGKQTATETELLELLEKGRAEVPQIRRYARDTPYDFLKRVELRSSLVIEAGNQFEGTNIVPFYQFRHLTFQEYLASVAIVNGHYVNYKSTDTVLTPLVEYLHSEEWKEVIPMVAVLSKKQAEPLISELVTVTTSQFNEDEDDMERSDLPTSGKFLLQALSEEAEASPALLLSALKILALYSKALDSDSYQILAQGPYGEDFFNQAWCSLQENKKYDSWLRNTVGVILATRQTDDYWYSLDGDDTIYLKLKSGDEADQIMGILGTCGALWLEMSPGLTRLERLLTATIPHMFSRNETIQDLAIWAWTLAARKGIRNFNQQIFDLFVSVCIDREFKSMYASIAMERIASLPRSEIAAYIKDKDKPVIESHISDTTKYILESSNGSDEYVYNKDTRNLEYSLNAAIIISYFSREIYDDNVLLDKIEQIFDRHSARVLSDIRSKLMNNSVNNSG